MYAERLKNQGRTMDRQTRRVLEVYVPTFSVCALLGVTGWITSDAIAVINGGGDGDDVDVIFLFAFASANFLVDFISSYMFYVRGRDILVSDRMSFSIDVHDHHTPTTKANLNMMSALTHVGGDTMRTASVFIAAVIATASNASSSLCDAWAAVVVSFTICCAVIPLINEIYKAARR
jgi:Co/Zn/Cd efflux system component